MENATFQHVDFDDACYGINVGALVQYDGW
jgi:hypothetical protein